MSKPTSISSTTSTTSSVNGIVPWYKHFWLWFIIILPATVVVASIVTVFIAIENEDSLVVDDYYKDGLGINQKLAQDKMAKKLGINASVTIDQLVGELQLTLNGSLSPQPQTIEMNWFHPTMMQKDISIQLRRNANGKYIGQLDELLKGRWYVQLSVNNPKPWRIKTEADLNEGYSFKFGFFDSSKTDQQTGDAR